MIILLKKDAEQSQVDNLLTLLRMKNITPSVSVGQMQTLIGCVGDVTHIDPGLIEALDVVESVQRIQEPYKAANRKFHPEPSVIDCGGVGYKLSISGTTYDAMPPNRSVNEPPTVKLYTHLAIREDDIELFGFMKQTELATFKLLLTVSGVGPRAAL